MLRADGLADAQGILDGCRLGAWDPVFLRLLLEMDEHLDPVLDGQSMTRDALAEVAAAAISAGAVGDDQQHACSWVVSHDLWRIWRRLPVMSAAAAAAARRQQ